MSILTLIIARDDERCAFYKYKYIYRYFVDEKPMWELQTDLVKNDAKYWPDQSLAQYTGGIVQVRISVNLFRAM